MACRHERLHTGSVITADTKTCHIEFIFRGDVASVASSRDEVMRWLQHQPMSDEHRLDLLIALQEALANAAIHGCKAQASSPVYCAVSASDNEVVITVRDSGPGFSQDLADPANFQASKREHGRGIPLMRSLVDDLSFSHRGSEVRLTKKIARS